METKSEKIERLKREIAVRQSELAAIVLGNPAQCVSWEISEKTKREIDEINRNSMRAAAMAKDVLFD